MMIPTPTTSPEYDRGFGDGLMWVVMILRKSAILVEQKTYKDFEKANGGIVHAIARIGDPAYAHRLRAVADMIESATRE